MSDLDKLAGRARQAADDLADDSSQRRKRQRRKKKGARNDALGNAPEKTDRKAEEAADLERNT